MDIANYKQDHRIRRGRVKKDGSQTKENGELVPAKKHRKIIRKEKLETNSCQVHKIMKCSQLSRQSIFSDLPEYIFRLIPSKKIFLLAGDILVEVEDETEQELMSVIFNEFRNILEIEKKAQSISLKIESVKPMKILNEAIYELENSQNNDNYKFAQIIKKHQSTIYLIQSLIQSVIDSYEQDPENLQKLLKDREEFMLQERDKILAQLSKDDEFVCIGSHMLSFANMTTTMAYLSVSQPSINMMGGKIQQITEHLLHKGFFNVFNYASRRALFEVNMLQQQMEQQSIHNMENYQDLSFEIPEIEICTLDNIHIITSCQISKQYIQYPQHLQFSRTNAGVLNKIEAFLLVRQNITQYHKEMLQKIRDESQSSPSSFVFKDALELMNLEYDAKCELILEKYYLEECSEVIREKNKQIQEQKLKTIESQKLPCKYRLI